jgi:hypothetical protein
VIGRVPAAVAAAALLAGCGSSSQRVARVLRATGIANTTFGQSPTLVATGVARFFGRPASAESASSIGYVHWGCGFDEIIWAGLAATPNNANSVGLTAYFRHSRFVGYSYGPPYGGPRARAVRDGLMLATTNGLGLGDALARAQRLYGRAFVQFAEDQGTPPDPRLERLPAWKVHTSGGELSGSLDSPNGPNDAPSRRSIGSINAGAVPNTPCR